MGANPSACEGIQFPTDHFTDPFFVSVCVGVDGWVWGGGVKSKKHMLGSGGESRGDIVRAGVVR